MTPGPTSNTHAQLAEYLRLNPDATAVEAVATVSADPDRWVDVVEDALGTNAPHDTLERPTEDRNTNAVDPADHADGQTDINRTDGHADPGESPEDASADTGSTDETPTLEAGGSGSTTEFNQHTAPRDRGVLVNGGRPAFDDWSDADFSRTESDTYPPALVERESWMGRLAGEKMPFAPWGDRDHAEADPEDDARYKWGLSSNYVDGDTVAIAEDDPRLNGRVFIQREDDPYAFVDGDDVRDPDTGEVHPAFTAILELLGATYADVSTSGAGVHAYYHAPDGLPIDGKGQATFAIDTEPWGANDDPPAIEIYANKHVNVTTGEHVLGTPDDVTEWDADALRAILQANGYDDRERAGHDTDRDRIDLEGYNPEATDADDTAEDMRDVYAAVERLAPRDLPLSTRQTGEDSTGWTTWDPAYRSSASGESLHYNGEGAFHDHKEGEAFGVLSLFATEEGIIHEPWDRLAGSDWFDAIDAARDAGAPIPEPPDTETDADPVAPLPLDRLDALADVDRERAARKRGLSIPSTADARDRLRDAVFRELRAGNNTVLDAPTALGKSYTVATEPWRIRESTTGGAPVVQLHQTREARDGAARATGGTSATGATLLGRKEASPVARGDHDPVEDSDAEDTPDQIVTIDGDPASDWFDRMCDGKGLPFSTALAIARKRNDQGLDELPPFGQEDPAVEQWGGLPRDDDGEPAVDVIHATHQFAYVPSIRSHTNLILDEQPDFRVDLSQDRIRGVVNAYLQAIDAPVRNFEAFVMLAEHDAARGDAAAERDAVADALDREHDLATDWYATEPDAHAIAPDLTRAIWNALRWEEPDQNGRLSTKVYHEPPRFDAENEGYAAGTWLSVVLDADHTIHTVRATPDLSQARAVVGLDAHPSMPMWTLNAGPELTRDAVLDASERRLWRRYERGLTVVQIGDAARPRSGDAARDWMNDDRIRAILGRLRDHYGRGFKTALSTIQTEPALRGLMEDVGIDLPDGFDTASDHTLHYGEEKSRNDFADELAGYVYGCMDPGDGMVLDALAELDVDAAPVTVKTDAGDVKREKGRTFTGADADTAEAVLASVRENHVAQAAGRYARNADDGESRAVVYLDTNAAPTGFVDIEVPGVEWIASDTQTAIVDALADRPKATTRELADAADCSKEHVRETLDRLEERGVVGRERGAGPHGADVYRDDEADPAVVDLGETTNDRLLDSNRWSLAICERHRPSSDAEQGSASTDGATDAVADGDRPPDPPE